MNESRSGMVARLALASARRPWAALLAWALLVAFSVATAIGGITGENLFGRLGSGAPVASTSESALADDLLTGADEGRTTTTFLLNNVDLADRDVVQVGDRIQAAVADIEGSVVDDPLLVPSAPDGTRLASVAPLFSSDGTGVLYAVSIPDGDEAALDAIDEALFDVRDELRGEFPEATVEFNNTRMLVESIIGISENDLARGESVALPIALVIMLVVFGGFIAAGVPLLGAVAAIVGALGALFGISHLMDIDTTVINVVTAVGLGLSIDYGLLMVSRFREEYRATPLARLDAIGRAAASAGRTVLFSGTTFAIASVGLLVFEPRLVRAIGVGALSVTVIAIASALTLVPALLAISGDKLIHPGALTRLPGIGRAILRFGDVAPHEGVFSRLARRVQRRPAIITVVCALALVALAAPTVGLQLANTSVDALPASSSQKVFVTSIRDDFPDAAAPRVSLVTENEADALEWSARVRSLPGVQSVGAARESGEAWTAPVRVDASDGVDVVGTIRADRPTDFPAWVTGTDGRTVDFSQSLIERSPWVALIVAFGTIVLLFLMTGSLVIPLKALLASALSLGASIGVLVWGFQWGNFAELMGFDAAEIYGVDPLVLVLVLVFGFGLAMDYEMFILSRITELIDGGVDGRESIALGLQRSGRIITSAGLVIVVVFAGFATGDLMVIKQLGVALAVAVTLDATLVRMLLVPAFMTWQLRIMWWAPRWMKRIHARFALRDA
jgi:uncharacterized membrane protein YdfJ with MMPL/SSD domain